jgi:hypothetical protein
VRAERVRMVDLFTPSLPPSRGFQVVHAPSVRSCFCGERAMHLLMALRGYVEQSKLRQIPTLTPVGWVRPRLSSPPGAPQATTDFRLFD